MKAILIIIITKIRLRKIGFEFIYQANDLIVIFFLNHFVRSRRTFQNLWSRNFFHRLNIVLATFRLSKEETLSALRLVDKERRYELFF